MYHKIKKTVIINRGIPGSGKSTIARQIKDSLSVYNYNVAIHSTDDYFIKNGKYTFTVKKAGVNHKKNQNAFLADLRAGVDIVICDNTNISPDQTSFYTQAAREYGYFVTYLSFHPRDLESHVSSQFSIQNPYLSHRVPREIMSSMMEDYKMYNCLLENSYDEHSLASGISFDADTVIEIFPNKYEEQKNLLGFEILKLLEIKSA